MIALIIALFVALCGVLLHLMTKSVRESQAKFRYQVVVMEAKSREQNRAMVDRILARTDKDKNG